jgi:hypothetical protein
MCKRDHIEENLQNPINNKIKEIVDAIDLNYILAEAQRDHQKLNLIIGEAADTEHKIIWSEMQHPLRKTYKASLKLLTDIISKNDDKIIRLNTKSADDDLQNKLDRNIILYFPRKRSISNLVKKLPYGLVK